MRLKVVRIKESFVASEAREILGLIGCMMLDDVDFETVTSQTRFPTLLTSEFTRIDVDLGMIKQLSAFFENLRATFDGGDFDGVDGTHMIT